jgi:chromosomal replication initiation ATPase DnaA
MLREFRMDSSDELLLETINAIFSAPVAHEHRMGFPKVVAFHGPTGVGKTCLLRAIAAVFPEPCSVIATDANLFSAECSDALKLDDLETFRRRYRTSHALLFDDVDLLASRRIAQQQLSAIIDDRLDIGRVAIFSAKRSPFATDLDPRLSSRLGCGITVPISMPTGDTLAARTVAKSNIDPKRVLHATARHFGLKTADLTGCSRRKQIATARCTAMYLIRTLSARSYDDIGALFGRRDHSTVLNACRRLESLMKTDSHIRDTTRHLVDTLTGQRHV